MFTSQFNKLIEDRNTSVAKISRATGIPPTTMYDWAKGRTNPSFEHVVRLSKHFDVPITYFAEGDA